MSYERIK